MKNINVEKINAEVTQFIEDRDWDQFHSIKNLAMALSVEASELVEIFQWMKESDSNEAPSNSKLKLKIEEEVADVFIYLMRLAIKSKIDIEEVVLRKVQKNSEKYPVAKARGNAKKYTDL